MFKSQENRNQMLLKNQINKQFTLRKSELQTRKNKLIVNKLKQKRSVESSNENKMSEFTDMENIIENPVQDMIISSNFDQNQINIDCKKNDLNYLITAEDYNEYISNVIYKIIFLVIEEMH